MDNIMIKNIATSAAIASILCVSLNAADTKNELVSHAALGYIGTTGNTDTKAFNFEAKLEKAWDKHVGIFTFDGQYADDSGVETKNKYFTELEYDYDFTEQIAFNYLIGYKDDKFSSFDYQFYTGPGAKYLAINTKAHQLSLEASILYSIDSYIDVRKDANGDPVEYPNEGGLLVTPAYEDDYAGYRLKGVYAWQVFDNLKFDQELSYRGSFDNSSNYFVFSKTGLSSKLSDIFSAGISYKVDYTHSPAEGKDSTDTTFAIGLIMDY
jgi:putative salt-induced outer membrane protein